MNRVTLSVLLIAVILFTNYPVYSGQHPATTLIETTTVQEDDGFVAAADGDVSNESVTSFEETVEDDVMLYPDYPIEFYTTVDNPNMPITSGSQSDTYAIDNNLLVFYNVSSGIDREITFNFTVPMRTVDQLNLTYYIHTRQGLDGSTPDTVDVEVYNFASMSFDRLVSLGDWAWYNSSVSFGYENYTEDSTVMIRFNYLDLDPYTSVTTELKIEYLKVAPIETGYSEGFADVSDWSLHASAVSSYGAGTDGDVYEMWMVPDDVNNDYVGYVIDIADIDLSSDTYYIEYSYKVEDGTKAFAQLYVIYTDSSITYLPEHTDTSFTTYHAYLSQTKTIDKLRIYVNDVTSSVSSGNYSVWWDYIRIAPSDSFGWQYDGSMEKGYSSGVGGTFTSESNGSVLTINVSYSGSIGWTNYLIPFDETTTGHDVDTGYYPFIKISARFTWGGTDVQPRWAFEGDGRQLLITDNSLSNNTWTTQVYNIRAAGTGDTDKWVRFSCYIDSVDDWFRVELEFVKAYGIANWTLIQSSSQSTTNAMWTENGKLHAYRDYTAYMYLDYDIPVSIVPATHNVWNLSLSTYLPDTGYAWDFYLGLYYDGGFKYTTADETRGPVNGTVSDIRIIIATSMTVSAIEFWSDNTSPTIEEKWNTPNDPTTSTDVTIKVVITDTVGAYTVTATVLSEPTGSSLSSQSFTLQDTNPSGAELWTVTIPSTLIAGEYVLEIDANDGANHAYSYLSFTVTRESQIYYIRIFDSLGDFIPFETFSVWRNGSRQYSDSFIGYSDEAYNITVVDRWGQTLNSTVFSAGTQELVLIVPVYSLKVMNWHSNFVAFNISRAGLTYTEIITPLETVHFRLYPNTYNWAVDYLNGTTVSGNLSLNNSTAMVITGVSIADVMGLSQQIWNMTTSINVTVVSTNNQVIMISINLENVNSTLYNQTIYLLANITNVNSTIYAQTTQLLSDISNVNSTIYAQTLQILSDISNVNSTLYAQAVDMLLQINNINSTLYAQTISIIAEINNIEQQILVLEETVDDLDINPYVLVPTPTADEDLVSSIVQLARDPTLELVVAIIGAVSTGIILGGIFVWRDQQNKAEREFRHTQSRRTKEAIG